MLAREALDRHARAYPQNGDLLPLGGVYAWRNEGEYHQWNPETIALLQHAVRHGGYESYEQFSRLVNEEAVRKATLRGLLSFRTDGRADPARPGRAGRGDRQALLDRRDVARLARRARHTRRSRSR